MDNNTFTKEIYEKNINNQPITYNEFTYIANQLLKTYELTGDICQNNSNSTPDIKTDSTLDKEIVIDSKNSTPDLKSSSNKDIEIDSENSTLVLESTSDCSYSTDYEISNNICNSVKLEPRDKHTSSNTLSYPSEFTKKNIFKTSNDLSDTLESIKSTEYTESINLNSIETIKFIELSESTSNIELDNSKCLDFKNQNHDDQNESNSKNNNMNKIHYGKINISVNPKIKFNLDIDINDDINISIM